MQVIPSTFHPSLLLSQTRSTDYLLTSDALLLVLALSIFGLFSGKTAPNNLLLATDHSLGSDIPTQTRLSIAPPKSVALSRGRSPPHRNHLSCTPQAAASSIMGKKTFLDLPAELRQMVYGHLFEDVKIKHYPGLTDLRLGLRSRKVYHSRDAAIVFVTKQTYADCLLLLLNSATINVAISLGGSSLIPRPFRSYESVLKKFQHIDLDIKEVDKNFRLQRIGTLMPNLISVTVGSVRGSKFPMFGAPYNSDVLFDPRYIGMEVWRLRWKILNNLSEPSEIPMRRLVSGWQDGGKTFRLLVRLEILRSRRIVGKLKELVRPLDAAGFGYIWTSLVTGGLLGPRESDDGHQGGGWHFQSADRA